ncbi:uncharacterized protein LACBIDRAFT_322878 [Laccaria bicolor S238N-H82]|uniref:Predicted protein n=1 Tax=Laccaria bicolor (strain S238N-H82 / ATCC MYA-4686) TaxID=486041 RepID=B0CVF3_LACBS|nr:uncharacterized protein LACBIDRAFT_322878 [Laccaria bicolor S238N-H82]EDR13736.1 predicted protein [Laccaria bicolor S238N-H82]|eukprot:XP_001876234.1 predicted protein [Laccaria bicolor S238N-H82]
MAMIEHEVLTGFHEIFWDRENITPADRTLIAVPRSDLLDPYSRANVAFKGTLPKPSIPQNENQISMSSENAATMLTAHLSVDYLDLKTLIRLVQKSYSTNFDQSASIDAAIYASNIRGGFQVSSPSRTEEEVESETMPEEQRINLNPITAPRLNYLTIPSEGVINLHATLASTNGSNFRTTGHSKIDQRSPTMGATWLTAPRQESWELLVDFAQMTTGNEDKQMTIAELRFKDNETQTPFSNLIKVSNEPDSAQSELEGSFKFSVMFQEEGEAKDLSFLTAMSTGLTFGLFKFTVNNIILIPLSMANQDLIEYEVRTKILTRHNNMSVSYKVKHDLLLEPPQVAATVDQALRVLAGSVWDYWTTSSRLSASFLLGKEMTGVLVAGIQLVELTTSIDDMKAITLRGDKDKLRVPAACRTCITSLKTWISYTHPLKDNQPCTVHAVEVVPMKTGAGRKDCSSGEEADSEKKQNNLRPSPILLLGSDHVPLDSREEMADTLLPVMPVETVASTPTFGRDQLYEQFVKETPLPPECSREKLAAAKHEMPTASSCEVTIQVPSLPDYLEEMKKRGHDERWTKEFESNNIPKTFKPSLSRIRNRLPDIETACAMECGEMLLGWPVGRAIPAASTRNTLKGPVSGTSSVTLTFIHKRIKLPKVGKEKLRRVTTWEDASSCSYHMQDTTDHAILDGRDNGIVKNTIIAEASPLLQCVRAAEMIEFLHDLCLVKANNLTLNGGHLNEIVASTSALNSVMLVSVQVQGSMIAKNQMVNVLERDHDFKNDHGESRESKSLVALKDWLNSVSNETPLPLEPGIPEEYREQLTEKLRRNAATFVVNCYIGLLEARTRMPLLFEPNSESRYGSSSMKGEVVPQLDKTRIKTGVIKPSINPRGF